MHEAGSRVPSGRRRLLVAQRRDLPAVRAQLRRRQRRRDRRPGRRPGAPAPTWPTLGIDAIWFNPWYPSPMSDAGYDISDYRAIEPVFGTLADADALIAEAHALGHQDHHRRRAEPRLRPAPVVHRGAGRRAGVGGAGPVLVPAGPRSVRRRAAEQLAVDLRRARLDPGHRAGRLARRVVPAPVRARAAGLQLGQRRTSGASSRTCCGSGSTAASTASGSTRRALLTKDAGAAGRRP